MSGVVAVLGAAPGVHPGVFSAVTRACEDAEVIRLPRVVVVLAGTVSLMILRCLRLRHERRPLPSSFTVYCLCPRASTTVPDLSHLKDAWFCTHTRVPVLM